MERGTPNSVAATTAAAGARCCHGSQDFPGGYPSVNGGGSSHTPHHPHTQFGGSLEAPVDRMGLFLVLEKPT